MNIDQEQILLSLLHDPPDKALKIQGHETRACQYASAVLGKSVNPNNLKAHHEDQLASAIERLPMPTAGKNGERAVGPVDEKLKVVHPLSGEEREVAVAQLDPDVLTQAASELVKGLESDQKKFFALWRLWKEKLYSVHPSYGHLPADTRVPDHTIWNHLDITAGLTPAVADAKGGAFLSFQIGPVQGFIASARTVRDLWSGSMILSYLTFCGLLPIVKALGPTALVYPSLRGIPFLDLWLCDTMLPEAELDPGLEAKKSPCLPNKFVAVVPYGVDGETAKQLAEQCVKGAQSGWEEIAKAVHKVLNDKWEDEFPGWDDLWDSQIDNFWHITTSVLPWREVDDDQLAKLLTGRTKFETADSKDPEEFQSCRNVRALADLIPESDTPKYSQRVAGQWQYRLELSAKMMAAQRAIRHIPNHTASNQAVPPKCSLMGSFEQMGPAGLNDSANFWKEARTLLGSVGGVRLGERDRLCAISLVKRFCGPAFFTNALKIRDNAGALDHRKLRFNDTATIASAVWLQHATQKLNLNALDPKLVRTKYDRWSGQWLHWSAANQDEEDVCPTEVWKLIEKARHPDNLGKPPAYYAILMMDGDEMGKWLKGEKSPRLEQVIHPAIRDDYYRKLQATTNLEEILQTRKPVGPTLHAAISQALADFSLHAVPEIVARYHGTLIYAGGDDVLVLLPTTTAMECARDLRLAFRGEFQQDCGTPTGYYKTNNGKELLMMGPTATVSAGLAIVHYKEDLRFALRQAREAESNAKKAGRDALEIRVCRRSGEHSSALCPWQFARNVDDWVQAFIKGASDRWAYHLRGELPTLEAMPHEAMAAEIRRQVNRAALDTRVLLSPKDAKQAGSVIAEAFRTYRNTKRPGNPETPRFDNDGEALNHFFTLCQTASFMARGRDE